MAYRGHKRGDIDGQSDIAFLISSLLSLLHTHTHIRALPSPPSPLSFFFFTSLLLRVIPLALISLLCLYYPLKLHNLSSLRGLVFATDHLDGTLSSPPPPRPPPVSSAAAVRSLCPCLQSPPCFTSTPNSYNHFTGSDKRRVSSV